MSFPLLSISARSIFKCNFPFLNANGRFFFFLTKPLDENYTNVNFGRFLFGYML